MIIIEVVEAAIVIGTMYYIVDQILKPKPGPNYVDNPYILPTLEPKPNPKPREEPVKPIPGHWDEPKKEDESVIIVRAGNGGVVNSTPRPKDLVDDKGNPNNGGLSAWRTLDIAKEKHPKETQFVYLSVEKLRSQGFIVWEDNKRTKHWTIRRMSEIEMQEWAATRESLILDKTNVHPLTEAVMDAIVGKVNRNGTSTSNNDR